MRGATLFALAALVAAVAAPAAFAANYVVLYKQQAAPADSTAVVQKAGGTVVATYPQIGVVVASSDSASRRPSRVRCRCRPASTRSPPSRTARRRCAPAGRAMNSWYGHGQVDARRAITNAR